MKKYLGILGMALGLSLVAVPANAVTFFSDDFESSASAGWALWSGYPNVTVTDNQNRSVDATGSGIYNAPAGTTLPGVDGSSTRAGKLWQVFWNAGPVASATFKQLQGTAATSLLGQQVSFQASTFTSSFDSYATSSSYMNMFVKYFDAGWGYLGGEYKTISTNPTDVWVTNTQNFTVTNNANLATIQIGFESTSVNYGGGSVYVDNVTMSTIPEPSSAALMGLGVAGLLAFRMRRKV